MMVGKVVYMLHQVASWILVIGAGSWLFFGSWQAAKDLQRHKYWDASRELGMTVFHLLMGITGFVIVTHFVPWTVEQPNGLQTFLLLAVPLVLLGRLVTRYMRV